jgi:serine/threonine protein kinase
MMVSRGQHLIGKVVGSYLLESLLGYGGSSAVFLAQQRHSPEQKVAVKVFLPRPMMDVQMQREFYRRFLHEAEVASKLEHSNILPILSYGEQDGLPYIAMPYMSGGTLAEYLSLHGPLSLQEALWYLEQIAAALDYAHEHGCVHCDIKPANVLLDSEGYALLSDFGIARVAHTSEDTSELPAAKGREAVVGTPDYISPEQALGRPVDGRSDIYSLGILLFYMLTKRLPFRADSPIALALLHVHEPPPSLMPIRTDVTYEIDQVILKALAKQPDERFQTAQQFCAALAEAIALSTKHEASAAPSALPPVIYRPQERREARTAWQILTDNVPRLVIIGTILLLLISGSSIIYFKYKGSSIGVGKVSHMPAAAVATSIAQKNAKAPVDYLADYNAWPVSSTFFYGAQHQVYYILNNSTSGVALAPYSGHQFSNFRLSVTMDEIHGKSTDYYGVAFRCSADQARYYLFEIGDDGTQYNFWLHYDGQWQNLAVGRTPAQMNKAGQSNTVTIKAQKNTFTFQINGKQVGAPVTVSSRFQMAEGQVGLYVEDQGTEVAFSHLYIDAL